MNRPNLIRRLVAKVRHEQVQRIREGLAYADQLTRERRRADELQARLNRYLSITQTPEHYGRTMRFELQIDNELRERMPAEALMAEVVEQLVLTAKR